MDSLRLIVKEKGVTAEDLRSYLLSLPACGKRQKLSLLSDKKDELMNVIMSLTFLTS